MGREEIIAGYVTSSTTLSRPILELEEVVYLLAVLLIGSLVRIGTTSSALLGELGVANLAVTGYRPI